MKIKVKPRLVALALAGGLSLTGCGETAVAETVAAPIELAEETVIETEEHMTEPAYEKTSVEVVEKEVEEPNEEIEEKEFNPYDEVQNVDVVMSNAQLNIRKEPDENSDRIGVIPKNDYLSYHGEEGNWYIVNCRGEAGYVSKDYSFKTQIQQIGTDIQKVVMFTEDKEIETLSEKVTVPKFECAEVYFEDESKYFVQTNDFIGYTSKDNTCDLEGTYAIVDISDQEIRVYEDNQLKYFSPVVTGRHNATHIGEFEIYDISSSRYLVGPGYKSYVDYMLKFDGNIGLHDAEYHTDANGHKHGWRDFSEFGGDTYITNGSHGCVNMPHDTAEYVYENMTYKDKVIVKK